MAPSWGFTVEIGLPKSSMSDGRAATRLAAGAADSGAPAGATIVVRVANASRAPATATRWERRRRNSRPKNPISPAPIIRLPRGASGWLGAGAIPPFGGPGRPGAACPTIAALAALFPRFGSISFSADFVAALVIVPVPVTVANRVRVLDAPLGRDPIVQTPVMLSYVPALGLADTKARPAGSRSVTSMPVASDGPPLKAVTV